MTPRSNSKTTVDALVMRCNDALTRGRQIGLASTGAYREAGAALRALKDLLPHGQFGPVASKQCGCCKQWRTRLMKLDREWADVEAAWYWAETCARQLGAKAYSVDGALALAREWRRAQSGYPHSALHTPRTSKARVELLRENANLQEKLAAAQAYIAALEERLSRFGSETNVQDIDEQTMLKVGKVAALWHRGGTAGERASAVNQLFGIADRLGWGLPSLLRECAVESPADWTFAPDHHPTSVS